MSSPASCPRGNIALHMNRRTVAITRQTYDIPTIHS